MSWTLIVLTCAGFAGCDLLEQGTFASERSCMFAGLETKTMQFRCRTERIPVPRAKPPFATFPWDEPR